MRQKHFKLMPDGNTHTEKLYTLFRHHISIIAKRVRTQKRCHKCFTHGWVGGTWMVNHGCDGCAEMETLLDVARDLLTSENGKAARNG